ncbi:MAG: EF-hand domain-containing protein [Steroidobacteraceae bacterium]
MLEEFASADRDKDGCIDLEEFRQLLKGLDADMSDAEIRLGFGEIDIDRDGRIDCLEFADWWSSD